MGQVSPSSHTTPSPPSERLAERSRKGPQTAAPDPLRDDSRPHVVIIGGGFGGLTAAQSLKHAPVRVTLVDRSNHHVFQPLLYQVATAGLAPSEIASPIRSILRKQKNTR